MSSVGYATLQIIPSAKGFGSHLGKSIGNSPAAVGKNIGMKLGGAVVAAVGTYMGAKAVFGAGMQRLLGIEDAQAKLRGLGHDADSVARIMDNALAAVKGTAFGMAEAATTASTAVAAGIKPGQELESYLRLTADAATIAGVSMEEMGSIINKTTTAGKVYTQELNQLADRGLPVFQWLQDAYGVSAEELRKMVSRGEVDAETFRRVMEENIGGAALASGDTTRGAFANLQASLGRIGAGLLGGVFPLFKQGLNAITEALGPVEDVAERIGIAFGEKIGAVVGPVLDALGPAVRAFFDSVASGEGSVGGLLAVLNPLGALLRGLAPVFPALGGALTSIGAAIGDVFVALGPVVAAVVDALASGIVALVPVVSALADAIGGALAAALPAVVPLFQGLVPIVQALVPVIASLAKTVGGALAAALPAVVPVVQMLADALASILPLLLPIIEQIGGLLVQAFTALAPILVSVVTVIGDLAAAILPALTPLLTLVAEILGAVITALSPLIPAVIGLVEAFAPLLPVLGDLVGALLPPLVSLIVAIVQPVARLATAIVGKLTPVIEGLSNVIGVVIGWITSLLEWFVGLFTGATNLAGQLRGVWDGIKSTTQTIWNALVSFVSQIPSRISSGLSSLGTTVRSNVSSWVNAIKDGAVEKFTALVDWVRGLPGMIVSALGNLGNTLVSAGRDLISGFIRGIKNMAGNIVSTVKSAITDRLPGFVKNALGIRSPSRVFMALGRDTAAGMALGIAQGARDVQRAADGLVPSAPAFRTPDVGHGVTGGLAAVAAVTPAVLEVRDVDGALIGRMQVEAGRVTNGRVTPLHHGRTSW